MTSVLLCIISLALANFGAEYIRDAHNYASAAEATWHQLTALMIYYFLWVRGELNNG